MPRKVLRKMTRIRSIKSVVVKTAVAGALTAAATLGVATSASAAGAGTFVVGEGKTSDEARADAERQCDSGKIEGATYVHDADSWSVNGRCTQ